jgi:hypothetical protein
MAKKKKRVRVRKAKPDTLKKIRMAMKACQKKGLAIEAAQWGAAFDDEKGFFTPSDNRICALGALLIYTNGDLKFKPSQGCRGFSKTDQDDMAAYVLGVDRDWVSSFIEGFDGNDGPLVSLDDGEPGNVSFDHVDEKGRVVLHRVIYKPVLGSYTSEFTLAKKLSAHQQEMVRAFVMGRKLRQEFIT